MVKLRTKFTLRHWTTYGLTALFMVVLPLLVMARGAMVHLEQVKQQIEAQRLAEARAFKENVLGRYFQEQPE